jgi:translation initiation factor IF-2
LEIVLAEKAKGIRVNELAKELGVESKAILAKLKSEGLGEAAPNHMSRIQLGLAESVREWFAHSGGGTAVETAPPVEVAAPRVKRVVRKRKADSSHEGSHDEEHEHTDSAEPTDAPTIVAEEPSPAAPEAPAAPAAPITEGPVAPVVKKPTGVKPIVVPQPAAPVVPPPQPAPAPAIAAEAPAPAAPQPPQAAPGTTAPPATALPGTAPAGRPGGLQPPKLRETITLANRSGIHQVERKPITPAPQMVRPAPAQVRGPTVIREEKPDIVPAPRPRRPMNEPSQTGFTTARPTTGRGV